MSRTTRNPYTGSKAIDPSCHGHGGCPACRGAREYKNGRQKGESLTDRLRDLGFERLPEKERRAAIRRIGSVVYTEE